MSDEFWPTLSDYNKERKRNKISETERCVLQERKVYAPEELSTEKKLRNVLC